MKTSLFRRAQTSSLLVLVVVVTAAGFMTTFPRNASAAQITARSLTLEAGVTDGGSKPSGVVNHTYDFTIPTNGILGSIKFQYCTTPNPATACTTPAGLSTDDAGVSLSAQTGATGFSLDKTTDGSPFIHRTAVTTGAVNTVVSYTLSGVTNPDNTTCYGGTPPASNNCTFFVRISTYVSEDTTGSAVDAGVVAASTATQIDLSGYMPESLVFCTGGTISTTSSVPDCSTATSGSIALPDFSPTATSFSTSQMAASTNAGSGYVITVNGATLTSGANTISAMGTSGISVPGSGQFGLNLVDNTPNAVTPDVGINVAPSANGTNFRGQAVAGYNTDQNFKFASGDNVADSANGGAGGTDAQIFTVSYIVNVPGSQPAGTYTTTLTYICTPTF